MSNGTNYSMARGAIQSVAEAVEATANSGLLAQREVTAAIIEPTAAMAQVFATLAVADALYDLASAVRRG